MRSSFATLLLLALCTGVLVSACTQPAADAVPTNTPVTQRPTALPADIHAEGNLPPTADPTHFTDDVPIVQDAPCQPPLVACAKFNFTLGRPAALTVVADWPANNDDLDIFIVDNATRQIVDHQAGYASYLEFMRTELPAGSYQIWLSGSLGTTTVTNGYGLDVWFDEPHGDPLWNPPRST